MNLIEQIFKRKSELEEMKQYLEKIKTNLAQNESKEEKVRALVETIKLGLLENMNLGNYNDTVTYSFTYCPAENMYLSSNGREEGLVSPADTTKDAVLALTTNTGYPYSMFESYVWRLFRSMCIEEGIQIKTEDYRSFYYPTSGQLVITVTAKMDLTNKLSK